MKKQFHRIILIATLSIFGLSNIAKAQNVNIPDANFKAYLVGNTSINTNGDGEIQYIEAAAYTGTIDCDYMNIYDLTSIETFASLTELSCEHNNISTIDLSQNTALITLYCDYNQLSDLDIINNTLLQTLYCHDNQISSLNLSSNTALQFLYCHRNQIYVINVSINTLLREFDCSVNQLTSMSLTNNTLLEYLYCFENQISSLNLSQNNALTIVQCNNNTLLNLNLSTNSNLISFDCSDNLLISLNVKNGNNINLTEFDARNNPNLSCIQVDNAIYSTANWTNIDPTSSFSEDCSSVWCTVDIPDANFKNYLINNSAINTNADNFIQCSEAEYFNGEINVYNLNITDLTGIEAFVNLTNLNCSNNQLSELNISANTALTYLHCSGNNLSLLDVSVNIALIYLYCSYNALDNINTASNLQLIEFSCDGNNLISLDVSVNQSLEFLECGNNPLTNIVMLNPNLKYLDFADGELLNINLSSNTLLEYFNCTANHITSLDLSNNSALTTIYCSGNQLTNLNIKNGNNISIQNFYTNINPNLTCIQVDDAVYSTANWTNIDPTSSFSEDCQYCNIDISVTPNGSILTANATGVTYQWIDCNNVNAHISGETNQSFTATTSGNYAVILTESPTCSDTSLCFAVIVISIDELKTLSQINIYPNPNNGVFTIENANLLTKLIITNILGETIYTVQPNTNKLNIDLSNHQKGVYFLNTYNGQTIMTKKIIIQ